MMQGMGMKNAPPVQGLREAMPQEMSTEMEGQEMNGMGEVVSALESAIALHQGHIDGTEPTSPESQQQLMTMLEQALIAIQGMSMAEGT